MKRLTRPAIKVDETVTKYLGKEIHLESINDRLLELILNGPTLMAVKKDVLRQLIRQLYGALQVYEVSDKPLTLEELRQMDAPVWCVCKPIEGGEGYWCLCKMGHIITPAGSNYDVAEIPHWVFLRCKPEQVEE